MRPKSFFGAIGRGGEPSLWNAVAYFVLSLAIYVLVQTALEEALIHAFQYDGATFVEYYAWEYQALGGPLAHIAAFATVLAYFAVLGAVDVINVSATAWLFLRWFVHFGEPAPFKSILAATLYTASFIALAFSLMSPLILLLGADDPVEWFYFFGPATASGEPRYQFVIAYIYLRAIAFTTNIMLHWGLIFTALLVGGMASIGVF